LCGFEHNDKYNNTLSESCHNHPNVAYDSVDSLNDVISETVGRKDVWKRALKTFINDNIVLCSIIIIMHNYTRSRPPPRLRLKFLNEEMRCLSCQWVKEGEQRNAKKNDRCTRIKPSFPLHIVQTVAPLFVRGKIDTLSFLFTLSSHRLDENLNINSLSLGDWPCPSRLQDIVKITGTAGI